MFFIFVLLVKQMYGRKRRYGDAFSVHGDKSPGARFGGIGADGNQASSVRPAKMVSIPSFRNPAAFSVTKRAYFENLNKDVDSKYMDFYATFSATGGGGTAPLRLTSNLVAGEKFYQNYQGTTLVIEWFDFQVKATLTNSNPEPPGTKRTYDVIKFKVFQWKGTGSPPSAENLLTTTLGADTVPVQAPVNITLNEQILYVSEFTLTPTSYSPANNTQAGDVQYHHEFLGSDNFEIMKTNASASDAPLTFGDLYLVTYGNGPLEAISPVNIEFSCRMMFQDQTRR